LVLLTKTLPLQTILLNPVEVDLLLGVKSGFREGRKASWRRCS